MQRGRKYNMIFKYLVPIILSLMSTTAMAVSTEDLSRIDIAIQNQIKDGAKLGVIIGIIENDAVTYRSYLQRTTFLRLNRSQKYLTS